MKPLLINQKMKNQFNTNRMFNFIRRQSVLNSGPLMISAGAVFGVLFVISLLVAHFAPESIPGLTRLYLYSLFLCGLVFTSKIFAELHNPLKSYAYVTLPVSTSEKILGSWLLSSPVFSILFFLLSSCLYLIACIAGNRMDFYFRIFDLTALKAIATFMVVQSFFFLGAVYFRKNNFMKTLFTLFLIVIVISICCSFLMWTLWSRQRPTEFHTSIDLTESPWGLISCTFWSILGPLMILISYYKLKEKQV
jgi:hypothetical protein